MRKKLQDKMFEISYMFELAISLLVGVVILGFAIQLVIDLIKTPVFSQGTLGLTTVLNYAITLAIGAELIKMLCKHTPETVIEVLAFALARQLIVGHSDYWQNLVTVIAIAILFAARKFLLKRHDLVETPDGLVSNKGDDVG